MSNTVKLSPFLKVVKDITSTFSKVKKLDYLNSGEFPIIDQSKNHIAGYTNNNSLINNWNNEEVVIFGDHTRVVKYVDFPIAIGADGVKVLKINSNISNCKYIYYFLKTTKIHDAGYSRHYKFLKALKIPILPLAEQQKIASFLTRIETLIQKREESIQLLDELIKSTFLDMFGDPVLNPKGWEKKKISKLAKVRIGPFGSLLHAEDYIIGGIPLINPIHIVNGEIQIDENFTVTMKKFQELSGYHLKQDDIIVARRGEIGRCAIVKYNLKMLCGTGSMFIRVTDDYMPSLLQYMIYNTSLKNYLLSKAKGVTMKNLNSSILGNMEIIIPPKSLQDKFASIVTKIGATKEKYQNSLEELNNLFNSTAQKAFKGELNLGNIEVIEKEISKEETQVLDEKKVLKLIQSGSFEAKDHVNEKQSYDDIRDMVLKLMDKGKITQKFIVVDKNKKIKKMVLEAKN